MNGCMCLGGGGLSVGVGERGTYLEDLEVDAAGMVSCEGGGKFPV